MASHAQCRRRLWWVFGGRSGLHLAPVRLGSLAQLVAVLAPRLVTGRAKSSHGYHLDVRSRVAVGTADERLDQNPGLGEPSRCRFAVLATGGSHVFSGATRILPRWRC